mmetsp:Transcript_22493/g.40558  ORF Transcript_22493/g.40558 Transcript_22493/m.40558 type:complete len:147 (-) Transcript_22493:214-654(-)
MIVTMVAALASTIPKRRMQRDPNVYTRNLPAVVDGEAFPYPVFCVCIYFSLHTIIYLLAHIEHGWCIIRSSDIMGDVCACVWLFFLPMAVITVNQNQAAAFASGTHPSNPFASRNAFIDVQSLDSNLVLFLFVVVEDDDDPSSSFG